MAILKKNLPQMTKKNIYILETLCRQDEFKCNNGVCITHGWQCDGTKDCMEGEDEICDK